MITIIAAVARNGVIGKDNDLPWFIPEDLERFKTLTKGHPIIMGLNTFLGILQRMLDHTGTAKLLPGRKHFVLTSKNMGQIKEILSEKFPELDQAQAMKNLIFCRSIGNAVQRAEALDPNTFVIGGTGVFREALPVAAKMEITEIHSDYEGDVYFPNFDPNRWDKSEDPREGYSFTTYTRRRL